MIRRINSTLNAVQPLVTDGEVCAEVSVTGGDKNWQQMTAELEAWREAFTLEMARDFAKQNSKQNSKQKSKQNQNEKSKWTVAVLCSGGCLDTLAAMRVGFVPIWSTETHVAKAEMWRDLTNTVCLGDTFSEEALNAEQPDYLKSGQPCPDYSFSGSQKGEFGATGWMFTKQVDIIKALMPRCFCFEISDNAVNVNGGNEVRKV